jgi:hypothetical protein
VDAGGHNAEAEAYTDTESAPPALNLAAWELYLSHRKDIRAKPLTVKGQLAAIGKWIRFSKEAQAKAVADSIANGYQGCWPEKHDNGSYSKASDDFDTKCAKLREAAGLD